MPEVHFPVSLFQDFVANFWIGMECHDLDPDTIRIVNETVDSAYASIDDDTPDSHVVVLDLDPVAIRCARKCFGLGTWGCNHVGKGVRFQGERHPQEPGTHAAPIATLGSGRFHRRPRRGILIS